MDYLRETRKTIDIPRNMYFIRDNKSLSKWLIILNIVLIVILALYAGFEHIGFCCSGYVSQVIQLVAFSLATWLLSPKVFKYYF